MPLSEDDRALDEIADRLAERVDGAVHHNYNFQIDGVISDDNLHRLVKKISGKVDSGRLHLKSSNSLRVTRRG